MLHDCETRLIASKVAEVLKNAGNEGVDLNGLTALIAALLCADAVDTANIIIRSMAYDGYVSINQTLGKAFAGPDLKEALGDKSDTSAIDELLRSLKKPD